MEAFRKVKGIAAPLLRINIDTDQIIPGTYMLRAEHYGYGASLFGNWRYLAPGGPPRPEFILNREPYSSAEILLADRNFGCGSSREAAVEALRGFGIRAVIAPSFGGILYNNAFRNGLLPVELPIEQVREIAREVEESQGVAPVEVDLEAERVTLPSGVQFAFKIRPLLREMLLEGQDEIAHTLSKSLRIEAYRLADAVRRPWVYDVPRAVP